VDIATVVGLSLGIVALVGGFILEGGAPLALLNFPASVIVFGGTIGATLITTPLGGFLKLPKIIAKAVFAKEENGGEIVSTFVNLAERARREGLLSLEQEAEGIRHPLLKKGVLLVVDGMEPEVIQSILEAEMDSTHERHEHGFAIFETMGGFGPTMGIIGTVMGLINVLSHLSDPSELGSHIAGAFIATLYGVMFANVVCLPLAGKLKRRDAEEVALLALVLAGILSIQAGDNPRVVRDKLEAYLPSDQRGQGEEGGGEPVRRAAQEAA